MGLFKKDTKAVSNEGSQQAELEKLLAEVSSDAQKLAASIAAVKKHVSKVSGDTDNISDIMQRYSAYIQEMNASVIEIANVMEDMESSFEGMSEEAKEGADYAQNSNNEAYDIMTKSEKERASVGSGQMQLRLRSWKKSNNPKRQRKSLTLQQTLWRLQTRPIC